MIAGYTLIGTIAGLLAFVAARMLGFSLWSSIVIYSLTGSISVVITLLIKVLRGVLIPRIRDVAPEDSHGYPEVNIGRRNDRVNSSSMKILAVDDDPFILELIPMICTQTGFSEVTPVSSGELALDALASAERPFDCMLFDISMPGMDGIELCKRVRAIPTYANTPIIMLTAMRDLGHLNRAFRAGATDYTTKPFDIGNLGARLRSAQITKVSARTPAAHTHTFDLSVVNRLEGMEDFVSMIVLTNYLMQIPRAELAKTMVFAVKIDQIDALFLRETVDELVNTLETAAKVISGIFQPEDGLIAYAGNGIFIIVSEASAFSSAIIVEEVILEALANTQYKDINLLDFQVSVGQAANVDATSARIAIDRATARAELRVLEKRSEASLPNKLQGGV